MVGKGRSHGGDPVGRDLVSQLEWLAQAVHAGQLRLPYDDRSYMSEGELFDFARANGIEPTRVHYMIEQDLIVPHRFRRETPLYNACSLSDSIKFVDEMTRLGFSLEMQQVLAAELAEFEEEAWKLAVAEYRRAHPSAEPGTLADARVRVAASLTVVNSVQRERRWVLHGPASDPARRRQFRRYCALAAKKRKERARRLEAIETAYGRG